MTLCIVALIVDIVSWKLFLWDITSYSLLQTLLLYGISFSHRTQRTAKNKKMAYVNSRLPASKSIHQFEVVSRYSCWPRLVQPTVWSYTAWYAVRSAVTTTTELLAFLLRVKEWLTLRALFRKIARGLYFIRSNNSRTNSVGGFVGRAIRIVPAFRLS